MTRAHRRPDGVVEVDPVARPVQLPRLVARVDGGDLRSSPSSPSAPCPAGESLNGHEIHGWPEPAPIRGTVFTGRETSESPPGSGSLRTGRVTIAYSSISRPAWPPRRGCPSPTSMGPPSSVLSRVIAVTASPVIRRVFSSTALVVEENTTFVIPAVPGPQPIRVREGGGLKRVVFEPGVGQRLKSAACARPSAVPLPSSGRAAGCRK